MIPRAIIEVANRLPGFTAEKSLVREGGDWMHRTALRPSTVAGVEPAEGKGAFCRRMLKTCVSQPDPRSVWCDSFILYC
jgi:hypothetical protein